MPCQQAGDERLVGRDGDCYRQAGLADLATDFVTDEGVLVEGNDLLPYKIA